MLAQCVCDLCVSSVIHLISLFATQQVVGFPSADTCAHEGVEGLKVTKQLSWDRTCQSVGLMCAAWCGLPLPQELKHWEVHPSMAECLAVQCMQSLVQANSVGQAGFQEAKNCQQVELSLLSSPFRCTCIVKWMTFQTRRMHAHHVGMQENC